MAAARAGTKPWGTSNDWQAAAYECVGMVTGLEPQLDLTLAFACGRSPGTVDFLAQSVFPNLALGKRLDLLRSIDKEDPTIHQAFWLFTALVRVRNGLAHSYGYPERHSEQHAVFTGRNRGEHKEEHLFRWQIKGMYRMVRTVESNLDRVSYQVAGHRLWGDYYGYRD